MEHEDTPINGSDTENNDIILMYYCINVLWLTNIC